MTMRNLKFVQEISYKRLTQIHLVISFHFYGLSEQVVSNKSSSIQQIILQNRQTLHLFAKIIKTESIYKSYLSAKPEGLVSETWWSN